MDVVARSVNNLRVLVWFSFWPVCGSKFKLKFIVNLQNKERIIDEETTCVLKNLNVRGKNVCRKISSEGGKKERIERLNLMNESSEESSSRKAKLKFVRSFKLRRISS